MFKSGPGRSYTLEEINGRPERGRRLLVARLAAGLSMRQAARLVGCSATFVSHLEAGYSASEPQVQRFLDAYERVSE